MKLIMIPMLVCSLALSGCAADMQERSDEGEAASASEGTSAAPGAIPATALLGSEVANAEGNHLGRVTGLLFDSRPRGQHYALLSVRDSDGQDKRFAYPVNALRRGAANAPLVLNVPVRNLEVSPGYEDGRGWPSPEVREGNIYARARDVIGKAVVDPLGNRVGTLDDVVLDLQTGRMRYAMVRFADGARMPVAAHAIRLSTDGPAIVNPDSQRRG